ncbi:MAG: NTP transferase domain-containing protein [Deltaproteobacteria bacterium]|nr:NTP transferase domain-containing protein [Deltaproteobacteria bacterium]MBW2305640.1 NTP transferase domain-containing protein [Deltaproteobacteria bacterium]
MKAGIIAAGRGERLARGGISIPKPLIPVGGEPLIARVIRAAAKVKATSIACIVNDLNPAVADYVRSGSWPVHLELVVKTTPSSMESLFSLAPFLCDEPFVLFTVDSVFGFESLEKFLTKAQTLNNAQGVLALTRFIDDEKPLWVRVDTRLKILAMGDSARPSRYVTAGFYYFKPDIFAMIEAAQAKAMNALRQFLGFLMESGYSLYGIPVSKTVDVDYREDIEKAETYLRETEKKCTA